MLGVLLSQGEVLVIVIVTAIVVFNVLLRYVPIKLDNAMRIMSGMKNIRL